jgi:predicted Zn-dependent peptidase
MVVEVSRLSNGLTVATETIPNFESVALGIWVKSGARNESDDEHGIAPRTHGVQGHAGAAPGTPEIENVGGEINAATSVETTSFCTHAQ